LLAALGSDRHERTAGRRGYRHGTVTRTVTTREGTRPLAVPRGRVHTATGATEEFRSAVLPRYARRTREVDEAVLGCYLAGANSRRIRLALKPLLGEARDQLAAKADEMLKLRLENKTLTSAPPAPTKAPAKKIVAPAPMTKAAAPAPKSPVKAGKARAG